MPAHWRSAPPDGGSERRKPRQPGWPPLVVPREDLDAATSDLVAALLAAPAGAVRATKGLLRDAGTRSYDDQRAAERAAQAGRLRDLAGRS